MNRLLGQALIIFSIMCITKAPSHAIVVNNQNQVFAQQGEKVTITYLSTAKNQCDQILNIYSPPSQFAIDTKKTRVGSVVSLESFKSNTEVILQLLDPNTGFSLYNDPRNNMDLENHVKVTDLGHGKYLFGWRFDAGNGKFEDLVIMIQASKVAQSATPSKSAVSSWRRYE